MVLFRAPKQRPALTHSHVDLETHTLFAFGSIISGHVLTHSISFFIQPSGHLVRHSLSPLVAFFHQRSHDFTHFAFLGDSIL